MSDLPRRKGPEGRPLNISPAREGWDINDRDRERRRRGTPLIRRHVWDRYASLFQQLQELLAERQG
jgi:hypothetical protein